MMLMSMFWLLVGALVFGLSSGHGFARPRRQKPLGRVAFMGGTAFVVAGVSGGVVVVVAGAAIGPPVTVPVCC